MENLLNEAVKIFIEDLKKIKNNLIENDSISDSLTVYFDVTESDETSLTMETNECYNLSISVGIGLNFP